MNFNRFEHTNAVSRSRSPCDKVQEYKRKKADRMKRIALSADRVISSKCNATVSWYVPEKTQTNGQSRERKVGNDHSRLIDLVKQLKNTGSSQKRFLIRLAKRKF